MITVPNLECRNRIHLPYRRLPRLSTWLSVALALIVVAEIQIL